MPRLSDTMEEGTVAKWLKQVGDKVEEGDILAEIETDKATMEFESFHEGTLLHIGIAEGDGAPVDTLLAIIGEEGEDISALLNGSAPAGAKETNEEPKEEIPVSDSSDNTTEIPEGVEIVKMPRLSDTMEEGTVAAWLKKVGDTVEEGDILAEIETDKATMEFESFYSGTLLYIGIQEGESSPVDTVLAVIGPAGTNVNAVLNAKPAASNIGDAPKEVVKEEKATTPVQESVNSSANEGQRIFASPLAKKIAKEKGINLSDVKGTGDHGRIVKKDIENFVPVQKAEQPQVQAVQASATKEVLPLVLPVGEERSVEVMNSHMRKTRAI